MLIFHARNTGISRFNIQTNKQYDLIIVGAGPVGAVVAERAANVKGWKCLVIDKRNHIAGNCYDSEHKSGVTIHNYGPHYFRTNNDRVIQYLSQFTEWIPGNYIVKSEVEGIQYPFPINLETLEKFFGIDKLEEASAAELLNSKRHQIQNPKNSEEQVLSKIGDELYTAFYLNYTIKQWQKHPRDLDPSVCGRIPVKLNRDPYYVQEKFRMSPKNGFAEMFFKILNHPLIETKLGVDYFDIKTQLKPNIATIYTGPIDRYFDYQFGKLEWRSLDFIFELHEKEFYQDCTQINYPNEHDYTRIVEIKHVTKQDHPSTVICKEYPKNSGDPFYPIPSKENKEIYQKYKSLADNEKSVFFAGRLAEYTYINSDQAVLKGLELFDKFV